MKTKERLSRLGKPSHKPDSLCRGLHIGINRKTSETFLSFAVIFWLFIVSGLQARSSSVHVKVISSSGSPVENATVKMIVSDSPAYHGTTRPNRELYFRHTGNGEYQPTEVFILDYSHDTELHVAAPDHETVKRWLLRRTGIIDVLLWHNNYYSRCEIVSEDRNRSFFSWNRNPWDECEVDHSRLIETFGMDEINILNSRTSHLFNTNIYKYAPQISNDFNNFAPRYLAYKTIIEQLLTGTSISMASVNNGEFVSWLQEEINANRQISDHEFLIRGAQFISNFSDIFTELNMAFSMAGYTFELTRAYREGYLSGIMMFIAYQGAASDIFARLESLSAKSWISGDEAFRLALHDVKNDFERRKYDDQEKLARAAAADEAGSVLGDILFSVAVRQILSAAGTTAYSLVTGNATSALIAGSIKTISAYVVYNFIQSVQRTGQQRALLSAIAQIDRTMMSHVPDRFPPAALRTEQFSESTQLDYMLRLQLGLLFNEARSALFSGEFKTWIGYQFQYSHMESRNQNQAYELKMAQVSIEKASKAQNDLENLITYLSEFDVNNDFNVHEVMGRYRMKDENHPGVYEATLDLNLLENGNVEIHGWAFWSSNPEPRFGPNMGEFYAVEKLGRFNEIENSLGCKLSIEFLNDRMIVHQFNHGSDGSCGGHNVSFTGEYFLE